MKKTLLTLLLGAVIKLGAFAQGYTFMNSTGTYTDLVNPTVISTAGWDPTASFVVPIGFNFTIDGVTFTNFEADGLGDLTFTNGTTSKYIFPFDGILVDRSFPSTTTTQSPVSYLLTGTAPSRILKLEFKNAGTADPQTQTLYANEFVNFQVWLYEGTNKVEVRYGTSNLAHATVTFFGESGPTEAIVTDFSSSISGYFLQGSATAPTLTTLTSATSYFGLTSIPANGAIYAFTPATASGVAKDLDNAAVTVFPNPATDRLHISGLTEFNSPATVKIYDALGKVVVSENLTAAQAVDINMLPKGTYFVEIISAKNRVGKQIIKL